jgi:hypothetical protein
MHDFLVQGCSHFVLDRQVMGPLLQQKEPAMNMSPGVCCCSGAVLVG